MKKTNREDTDNHHSVPILSWDFHHEYVDEMKAMRADLKKLHEISSSFSWDKKSLKIEERIKSEVVVITDLNLKIVFASNKIKTMTGYMESEILGKTPKMFQGPETCPDDLDEIRNAIKSRVPFVKTIKNYKKNGHIYNCKIDGFPVYTSKGTVTHFIAFEKKDLTA
jgi:PAS domain S-box-containing protein